MSKNNFYFSHDGNARNDEKLLSVRVNMGAEGYGIYFMIIEKLLESGEYTLIKDYNVIAFDLRVGSDKIKAVVENFGLFQFTEDGKRFYSESLLRRMKPLDNLRKQRSEAGKKSAENRKANDRSTTASTTVEKESNKTPFLLGENSTKESKVNNISFLEKKKQKTHTSDEGKILENSEDENPNADLKTEETLSKSFAKKFSLIWDLFKGKKNSFEKDYIKFLKKTEGLEIDFEKLQEEAHKARDIYFQSWLNQIFPKPSKGEETFDFHKALLNAGFDPELSDEWLKIRNVKKAVNSELAFKNFMREVKKSGRSPNEVLAIVVQKQWKGFEASWLHNEQFTDKQRAINYETTSTVTADEPKFGRATKSVIEQSLRGWE